MENKYLIFVYGTLKCGYSNNIMLKNSIFIGEAFTCRPLYMYSCGIPIVAVPSKDNIDIQALPITGEAYKVSKKVLKELDVLEGHPDIYVRILEEIQIGEIKKKAYIYVRSNNLRHLSEKELILYKEEFWEGIKIVDSKYKWGESEAIWDEYN